MKNNWEDVIYDIQSIYNDDSELENILDCVCEKGKEIKEKEIRNMIAKMLSEFANTPLNKRGSGWDWLIKLYEKIKNG